MLLGTGRNPRGMLNWRGCRAPAFYFFPGDICRAGYSYNLWILLDLQKRTTAVDRETSRAFVICSELEWYFGTLWELKHSWSPPQDYCQIVTSCGMGGWRAMLKSPENQSRNSCSFSLRRGQKNHSDLLWKHCWRAKVLGTGTKKELAWILTELLLNLGSEQSGLKWSVSFHIKKRDPSLVDPFFVNHLQCFTPGCGIQ